MKRVYALLTALALMLPGSVYAATTVLNNVTTSYGQPFQYAFTTVTVGNVTARAQWTPKPNTRYVLRLKHLRDANDPYSYDQICDVYEPLGGSGSGQTVGDYSCTVGTGESGFWTVDFFPLKGKVTDLTVTVTTPD